MTTPQLINLISQLLVLWGQELFLLDVTISVKVSLGFCLHGLDTRFFLLLLFSLRLADGTLNPDLGWVTTGLGLLDLLAGGNRLSLLIRLNLSFGSGAHVGEESKESANSALLAATSAASAAASATEANVGYTISPVNINAQLWFLIQINSMFSSISYSSAPLRVCSSPTRSCWPQSRRRKVESFSLK